MCEITKADSFAVEDEEIKKTVLVNNILGCSSVSGLLNTRRFSCTPKKIRKMHRKANKYR